MRFVACSLYLFSLCDETCMYARTCLFCVCVCVVWCVCVCVCVCVLRLSMLKHIHMLPISLSLSLSHTHTHTKNSPFLIKSLYKTKSFVLTDTPDQEKGTRQVQVDSVVWDGGGGGGVEGEVGEGTCYCAPLHYSLTTRLRHPV